MEIKIYSKPNCSYCDKAKIKLSKYNPEILMLDVDYTKEEFFNLFPNMKDEFLYIDDDPRVLYQAYNNVIDRLIGSRKKIDPMLF